ncbi:MAG: MgtC/SapB family protein [Gemmatimonadetes bacterium]|nr:MgtC/SapB family protein [Gemmatimonadota bacterium]
MQVNEMIIEAFRLDLAAKLLIAILIGGGVGLERELKGKPAGLRTNILICLGSALLMDLSMSLSTRYGGDPGRIAAQVVTGIGFLGAGTILHTRGQITGLTSAATIWVVAALGLTIGAGYFVEAAGSSLTVILVLVGLGWVEKRYLPHGQDGHNGPEPQEWETRRATDRRGRPRTTTEQEAVTGSPESTGASTEVPDARAARRTPG